MDEDSKCEYVVFVFLIDLDFVNKCFFLINLIQLVITIDNKTYDLCIIM